MDRTPPHPVPQAAFLEPTYPDGKAFPDTAGTPAEDTEEWEHAAA